MNKYEKNLLDRASKLDALVDAYGEITKYATAIVEEKSEENTIAILRKISVLIDSSSCKIEAKNVAKALKESIVEYYGYLKVREICNKSESNEDRRNLKELMEELEQLIGLKKVKDKVNDLIIYQNVQKMRRDNNLQTTKSTLHLAFVGNPGTGKTTVARIVGRVYKQIGLLSKGHFVEVSRTDLIAGYQGQTALKVKKIVEKAKGGVLFIDEAYSITENDQSDSYGRECLTELTKALEDYRNDLVVIVAGYTEPMNKFFESNPGLRSRFNTFIEFDDYDISELEEILKRMCKSNDYELSNAARLKIRNELEREVGNKDNNFANGRMIRNIYENLVMNHARRIVKINNVNREVLSVITEEDV